MLLLRFDAVSPVLFVLLDKSFTSLFALAFTVVLFDLRCAPADPFELFSPFEFPKISFYGELESCEWESLTFCSSFESLAALGCAFVLSLGFVFVGSHILAPIVGRVIRGCNCSLRRHFSIWLLLLDEFAGTATRLQDTTFLRFAKLDRHNLFPALICLFQAAHEIVTLLITCSIVGWGLSWLVFVKRLFYVNNLHRWTICQRFALVWHEGRCLVVLSLILLLFFVWMNHICCKNLLFSSLSTLSKFNWSLIRAYWKILWLFLFSKVIYLSLGALDSSA